jgi:hypothetical protein
MARKKARDASFSTPVVTPSISALNESLVPELTSWFAWPASIPAATISTRMKSAPRVLGTPWRLSKPTSCPATAAITPATTSGMKITEVNVRSHTTPTSRTTTPTSSQAVNPASRSQLGAANRPASSPGSISMY